MDHRLAADLGDLERQLEQVLEAQLVIVRRHQARQVFLGFLVLRILFGGLGQVEYRQGLAFLVLAGAVDDLVDVSQRILVRRQHDAEAFQVGDLALVDLAVEQRQLVFQALVVAADIAQRAGDVGDRRAARLGQGQRLVLAVGVGVDQQLQAALGIFLTVELGHALQAHLGVERLNLAVHALQCLPAVLVVVEQRQQVVQRIVHRVHERRAEGQVGRQQLAAAQGVFQGAFLGFQVGQLATDQLQLGGNLLHAFGEGIAGALEFVLGGFGLGQLLQLGRFLGGQGLAAAEILQRLLRIQHRLVQRLGLGLAGVTVDGYRVLGLELLEFALQTILLVAQGGAIGECLQGRRIDLREVDGQPRHREGVALETIQHGFHGFDPVIALGADAFVAAVVDQGQAEQLTVEQAHQAVDVGLGELLAQPRVAVVVGVVELLLDRLQALFQVAQALVQILTGELAGLRQGAGQLVVSVLGGEQLLLQYVGILDQGEAVLQHRQLAEPALGFADLPLQAHQFGGAAALLVLQTVLLATVMLGLDHQLFLAGVGVVVPSAEQVVEQRREAMQLAAQQLALRDAGGQRLDQRPGCHQRLIVLFHAPHVAEGFFRRGDVVDAA